MKPGIPKKGTYLNKGVKSAHNRLKSVLGRAGEREKARFDINSSVADDRGNGYRMDRELKKYRFFTSDYTLHQEEDKKNHEKIRSEIRELFRKKKNIEVLDIGAGKGRLLAEIKGSFPKNARTTAISMSPPEELKARKKLGLVDEVIRVSAESWLPKRHYDLITSYYGGIYYSPHPEIAISKAINALNRNGVALIGPNETKKSPHTHIDKLYLFEQIRKSGRFEVTVLANGIRIKKVK